MPPLTDRQQAPLDAFLKQCLLIDIEINERNRIYSLGAVCGDEVLLVEAGRQIGRAEITRLDAMASNAGYVMGHNILVHDLPRLAKAFPSLTLLKKESVDTLYLSPLAFPENPYHRLVKNYKLVRDSINNPVDDARLASRVFREQWQAFAEQLQAGSIAPLLHRFFLESNPLCRGTAHALGAMGAKRPGVEEVPGMLTDLVGEAVCSTALEQVLALLEEGSQDLAPLAYVTAWLTVAGGNSVLPPWVRHHFPRVAVLLHQLREQPCAHSDCRYCRRQHDPSHYLRTYWGFDSFRPAPTIDDGTSLQEAIIDTACRSVSLFATLPTGGGKSLCYQLPALMRYQRRNLLTIVISPLQALMKDQVDNFCNQTGTSIAGALYGMLTMPERGRLREQVRHGDIGILYVSPEQLRNRSFIELISQREIGAWVFDEAHCLSKWGHDFRPDYLYSIRFIRECARRGKSAIPPVQCFTATAKRDVRLEIIDIIQSELGLKMTTFSGGHERTNLHYEVWPVDTHGKYEAILQLLRSRYDGTGSVVIYCATRKNTVKLADFLNQHGFTAEAFHAGLEPMAKKWIQDDFISGSLPVICATNAFGMGIDKDDVRLVVHADIPGSLENYLQEAGRAGRDRNQADCILVYSEKDIEGQFRMSCMSRLTRREIAQFLRGLRHVARDGDEVVLTTGELLHLNVVDVEEEAGRDHDTRIKTAVSWLERSGFLERNENNTRIFQGKPTIASLAEAEKRIGELDLSARQQQRWLAILAHLMKSRPERGFSADELAELSSFAAGEDDERQNETESQRVIRTLNDMAQAGLLSKETTLSGYVRHKVQDNSCRRLSEICRVEKEFLKILMEEAPDSEMEHPLQLDLRQVNQRLLNAGYERSSPAVLRRILEGWSRDGKGMAAQKGSISLRSQGNNIFTVMLHRDWQSLAATMEIRRRSAEVALQTIGRTIGPERSAGAAVLTEFTMEQIVAALKHDLILLPRLKDPFAAAERALTFLHEQDVIALQQGLAVFRQAMTISLQPASRGRRFGKEEFAPLATHYQEKTFQIHVMNEYARSALKRLSLAMKLVTSYFNDERDDFIKRFFPGREKQLERATGEQSYQRIVEDLGNRIQEKIVAAPVNKNMLVLAGPGSGKTRTVAHRVAYLLRVQRIRPEAVLVLCFNRSAIVSLRKRIRDLAGDDMTGVTTLTFHGLALRLTGRSLVGDSRRELSEALFNEVIREAICLLRGEREVLGLGAGEPRDVLTGRFSHILVDEYQDIDADQYELISLLSGRTEQNRDRKPAIMAVGDDDQNIYRFRGANIDFIRRFQEEYQAEIHYLVENYRSTAHIIAAANDLISHNRDRMKTGHTICINRARQALPEGGNWQQADPVGRGRVGCLTVANTPEQAAAVYTEFKRLQGLRDDVEPGACAVLARDWAELDAVRGLFELHQVPVCLNWNRSAFPRLTRVREYADFLDLLRVRREECLPAAELMEFLPGATDGGRRSIWSLGLADLLAQWREETGNLAQPVPLIEQYIHEALQDQYRAGGLANGIFLSTAHSAKGLEFDHVFLVDGGWQQQSRADMEEERRLYYVAMSRARETLCLFERADCANPHTILLDGPFLARRPGATEPLPAAGMPRYHLLGMQDLFLDFAGLRPPGHPVHQTLAGLAAGDTLQLAEKGAHLELKDRQGLAVARLSRSACERWRFRLDTINEIRIVAIVRRFRRDIRDADFKELCQGEQWEVPLVEFCTGK